VPIERELNKSIRLLGLKPGVYPGNTRDLPAKPGAGLPSPGPSKAGAGECLWLILSGAYYPDLRIGVLRRERIKHNPDNRADTTLTMEP